MGNQFAGAPDAFAFELGTGGVGRNAQAELVNWRRAISLVTHEELQNACSAVIGPLAYKVPDAATMAQLVPGITMAKLIQPALAARRPVIKFHPNDKNAKRAVGRYLAKKAGASSTEMQLYGLGDMVSGDTIPEGEGAAGSPPAPGETMPGQAPDGGPLPGYYFKPDASGGSFVKAPSGWPPAASYRPGNWDFDNSKYALAGGDTLSGLAVTYLGSPQRWKEIWDANPQEWRFSHNPDKLMAGTWIQMPFEARDMAKKMLAKPPPDTAPSTVGKKAPIPVAGENTNAPVVEGGTAAAAGSKLTKALPWIAGAAVLGGVVWYVAS